jgi:large subunit ribosomal protein L30
MTQTKTQKKAKTEAPPKAKARSLKVTQLRSGIGFDQKQTLAQRGLGLRRIRHTVEVPDTPGTRGLILKVRHLVTVTE